MRYSQLLAVLLLVSIANCVSAQSQKSHSKQHYTSENGKLYWPGSEPVYLHLSISPSGEDKTRIKSRTTPDHADPMYLDTEGLNYIRSKWAVDKDGKYLRPQQEVLFEINKDSRSPSTEMFLTGAVRYRGDKVYYGPGLQLTLESADALSGVQEILISKNGGAYAPYVAQAVNQEQDYTFKYYAFDKVGNVENEKTRNFQVDLTSPMTRHLVQGEKLGDILAPTATIKLTSTDQLSGVKTVKYNFDEVTELTYGTNVISLKSIKEGNHVFYYYAQDQVDNKEDRKEYAFYLDRTAPDVTASVVGDQYQNRGRVFVSKRSRVKLTSSDNKSGVSKVWYTIDGGEEIEYEEPFDLPGDGNTVIGFYGVDKVGNTFKSVFDESKNGRQALEIDMEAPEISHSFGTNKYMSRDTTFIRGDTDVILKGVDDDSGMKQIGYKINNGGGLVYDEAFTTTSEGIYTIDYFGTDNVNNRNSKSFFYIVDNEGPETEYIFSMDPIGKIELDELGAPLGVYSAGVKIYLAATDKQIDTKSIFYSLNGKTERSYGMPIAATQKGINTLKVRATDMLGNETVSEEFEFFIK